MSLPLDQQGRPPKGSRSIMRDSRPASHLFPWMFAANGADCRSLDLMQESLIPYVMDTDGSHVRVTTDSLALRGNPGWSPDEQSVVSAVIRDGEPRLRGARRLAFSRDSQALLILSGEIGHKNFFAP